MVIWNGHFDCSLMPLLMHCVSVHKPNTSRSALIACHCHIWNLDSRAQKCTPSVCLFGFCSCGSLPRVRPTMHAFLVCLCVRLSWPKLSQSVTLGLAMPMCIEGRWNIPAWLVPLSLLPNRASHNLQSSECVWQPWKLEGNKMVVGLHFYFVGRKNHMPCVYFVCINYYLNFFIILFFFTKFKFLF